MFRRIIYKILGELDIESFKKMGGVVGDNFKFCRGCILDKSHCWLIKIGDNVTFSHNVHILAHDASTKMVLGYTKIGQVIIGNNVFIGAGSIVLPGITIGNNVIIGAGSVVTHDIPDGCVFAGNPARKISSLEDYAKKSRKLFADSPQYNESYTIRGKIDKSKKMQMNNELIGKAGYVK